MTKIINGIISTLHMYGYKHKICDEWRSRAMAAGCNLYNKL